MIFQAAILDILIEDIHCATFMITSTASVSPYLVSLQDLFYAFRKAKADCFFENSVNIAKAFVEYEENIAENLSDLHAAIIFGGFEKLLQSNLGTPRIVAKKLTTQQKAGTSGPTGHRFFSDPQRAFNNLKESHDLIPEFRLIGDFPVIMHILSALWINLIGHKYDSVLTQSAYGSRLRRYKRDPSKPENEARGYHIEAVGSFEPYFEPYKKWRAFGLNAIRDELKADRAVIAISMDLTSYYHNIDPSFISNPSFLKQSNIELSEWELDFTKAFVDALHTWSKIITDELVKLGCNEDEKLRGGIPIGLSISKVISNVLLAGLDKDIESGLAPVFYGRYVDDIFLVLKDPGSLRNSGDLLKFIGIRTTWFPSEISEENDQIALTLPSFYQNKSQLILQQSKQKLFFLKGQAGLDLLNNIETQIRSVSSERRLMPAPDNLELMTSAKVLTAAGHPSEEADTLRRADGLAVRRLGWSIQLRAVETLARDLRQNDWKIEREKFYEFSRSHILRPDRILDHLDYLPRLLSLTVALMDWAEAYKLISSAMSAIDALQESLSGGRMRINGVETYPANDEVWKALLSSVIISAGEAVIRSMRWSQRHGTMRPISETAVKLCQLLNIGTNYDEIAQESLRFRESDWAKIPYKDHLRRDATRQRPKVPNEELIYGLYAHEDDLRDFLKSSEQPIVGSEGIRVNRRHFRNDIQQDSSLLPYLFPTRPYSTQEISLFLPALCIFGDPGLNPSREWARFVRAVRGVWVWGSLVTDHSPPLPEKFDQTTNRIANLGGKQPANGIKLGISSLLTTDQSFKASASGKSDLSPERYKRIERLVNQAISAHPRPTHLLLPELALPERWLDTVSGRLRDAGISLIAGLDYAHAGKNQIYSEAVLVLLDDRLGFPSSVQIRQAKTLPAPGEEETLLKYFGKDWSATKILEQKPIYIHQGFCFGVLVCSELQNVSHRLAFQGNVDCMMILSWNQDLETFSALVESASLDVHAHVALVNNRKYGDSRVRAPGKQHHARDLCRIRGGENEHIVVVEINTASLRAFQSRDKRWPSDGDPYKPVPEGFKISNLRKSIPK